MEEVLIRLAKHGLKASLEKTEWGVRRVGYLGFILSKNSVEMDKAKVDDLLKIPIPPVMLKEKMTPRAVRKCVRQFLGLSGFYRSFI